MTTPTKATAPVTEIGYTQAVNYNWWLYENETTPELVWPQSVYVYDQMRKTDSQVGSILRAVNLLVLRTPWRVDPAGARDEVVQFVADDLGLPIVGQDPTPPPRKRDRFSWKDHLAEALLMLPLGHSYFEQVYRIDPDGGRAHLRKLALRPAKTIEYIDVAEDGGLTSIKQYWVRNGERPKPIPVDHLVAYIHAKEGGNWLGTSILRNCYKNWLLKDRLLRVQAQTIERNGMGIPLYTGPETATDLSAGLAMAKAWRAGEAAGSAVPYGATLKLVGVEGTLPNAEPAIRYHDESIAKTVLAHFLNLGQQMGTGSYALGATLGDFFTLGVQTVGQQIGDVATSHVVEDLVDVNWGPDEPSPRIVFDEIGSRQAATAQALKLLIDVGVIHPDDILEQSTRQQYGLPPRDPNAPPPGPLPGMTRETLTGPAPGTAATPAPAADTKMGAASVAASADLEPAGLRLDDLLARIEALESDLDADEDDDLDEDTEALLVAMSEFAGEVTAKFNPSLHPHFPKGSSKGGQFRSTVDKLVDALKVHHAGGGKGDPFAAFDREQLRRAAVKRGITLKRGASRDDISAALIADLTPGGRSATPTPKVATPRATTPKVADASAVAKRKAAAEHKARVENARGASAVAAIASHLAYRHSTRNDPAALVRALREMSNDDGSNLPPDQAAGLRGFLADLGDVDKLDTSAKLQRKIDASLRKRNMHTYGEPGATVKYNPTHMEGGSHLVAGQDVQIVQPAFTYKDPKTGEVVEFSKPHVERKADPTAQRASLDDALDEMGRRKPKTTEPFDRAAQALADGADRKAVALQLRRDATKVKDREDAETYRLLAGQVAKPAAARPKFLDDNNKIKLDEFARHHGIDVSAFRQVNGNIFGAGDNPYSTSYAGLRSDLVGRTTPQKIAERMRANADNIEARVKGMEAHKAASGRSLTPWQEQQLKYSPGVVTTYRQLADALAVAKIPRTKPKASLGRTELGEVLPIDESRFRHGRLKEGALTHRGEAVPKDLKHAKQPFQMGVKPVRPGLTSDENGALDDYTSGAAARALNGSLRSGKNAHGSVDLPHVRPGGVDLDEMRRNLDAAIDAGELTRDTVLYRGVLLKPKDRQRLVPGAILSDPGYSSTATTEKSAADVIEYWKQAKLYKGTKPAMFRILAPKGTRGALGHEGVDEVVLPRDQKFRVVREDTTPNGDPLFVLEVVAPETDAGLTRGHDIEQSADYAAIAKHPVKQYGVDDQGDHMLGHILTEQGFDGKARVVPPEEMDQAIKRGAIEVWRGIRDTTRPAAEMVEEYRTGRLYPGFGVYGGGTYTTPDRPTAENYGHVNNGRGALLRLALRRDARVISHADLKKLYAKFANKKMQDLNEQQQAEMALVAPGDTAALRRIRDKYDTLRAKMSDKTRVQADMGRFAALLGYDAIHAPIGYSAVKGKQHFAEYVILNRTAMIVQEGTV